MSNAMEYVAYPAMILRSIMPSKGPTSGQMVVTLKGENFGGAMSCRVVSLQASTAPAKVLTSTEALCVTPAQAGGMAEIEISRNALDFSASKVDYLYEAPASIISLVPSTPTQLRSSPTKELRDGDVATLNWTAGDDVRMLLVT